MVGATDADLGVGVAGFGWCLCGVADDGAAGVSIDMLAPSDIDIDEPSDIDIDEPSDIDIDAPLDEVSPAVELLAPQPASARAATAAGIATKTRRSFTMMFLDSP